MHGYGDVLMLFQFYNIILSYLNTPLTFVWSVSSNHIWSGSKMFSEEGIKFKKVYPVIKIK